ncbi:uncharacterized protein METZ01_LOCUS121595, partial [marine metagenome]
MGRCFPDLGHAGIIIVTRTVYPVGDGAGLHPGCMFWFKQLCLRCFFRIEPGIEFCWFQDYWHAVMDRVEFFRGLGGQNGEADHFRTVTISPPFPQTGENKGRAIYAANP